MSTIGIVSQEYKNTANLFKKFNEAIVLLKKCHFKPISSANINEEEIVGARKVIASILSQIIAQLNDDNLPKENKQELSLIPPFFIKRLQEQHRGSLEWYIEDLNKVYKALMENQALTLSFIDCLDKLCEQLDVETTRLYRKLRRR